MNRIFLPGEQIENLVITGEQHHQLTRVLRVYPGWQLEAICGDGFEYTLEIISISRSKIDFKILERTFKNREPDMDIILNMGMLKGKALEDIIPQLVYLGIKKVVPFISCRSQSQEVNFKQNRMLRLEKIIQRASALCGRTRLMEIDEPLDIKAALDNARNSPALFFWEESPDTPLKQVLQKIEIGKLKEIVVFIGPEGGFTSGEAELAREWGIKEASLGQRVLDARTAPLAAISAILYETKNI